MKIELDCEKLNTKNAILQELRKYYAEMYSLNYDAFIDAATFLDEKVFLILKNAESLEDRKGFEEVLEIIQDENPSFRYTID